LKAMSPAPGPLSTTDDSNCRWPGSIRAPVTP
jgi:hypothetical protein